MSTAWVVVISCLSVSFVFVIIFWCMCRAGKIADENMHKAFLEEVERMKNGMEETK